LWVTGVIGAIWRHDDPARRVAMGEQAREARMSHYARRVATARFVELLRAM
jgi:hypothetical protein